MPTTVKVIRTQEFVRARPNGAFDLEASEQMLMDIAKASADMQDVQVLIDTRHARGALTAGDLWYLADRLGRYRHAFSGKTAVLCPTEKFDRARFFALVADGKGFDVQAFTSYEEAMTWLAGEET
jgi:hypothetical protein